MWVEVFVYVCVPVHVSNFRMKFNQNRKRRWDSQGNRKRERGKDREREWENTQKVFDRMLYYFVVCLFAVFELPNIKCMAMWSLFKIILNVMYYLCAYLICYVNIIENRTCEII